MSSSATIAKERLYSQLATNFANINRALMRTAVLAEDLEEQLQAMRVFVGLDAAKSVIR